MYTYLCVSVQYTLYCGQKNIFGDFSTNLKMPEYQPQSVQIHFNYILNKMCIILFKT